MSKNREVLKKVYGYFLPSIWRRDKLFFFAQICKLLISTVQPFISIYFLPAIIEELMGQKRAETLIMLVVVMVVSEFVLNVLSAVFRTMVENYSQRFENEFKAELSRRIMELDFQLTEDKNALDQLELARNGMSWYSGGINGLMEPFFNAISGVLTLLGVAYLIITKAPIVLALAIPVVAATTWINNRINVIEQEGYRKLSNINRIFGYLIWGLSDFRFGKDIRLYEAKDMMIGKWSRYTEDWNTQNEAIANKQLPYQLMSVGTNILHDVSIYFYLGYLAIHEIISIATAIQMVASASTFVNALNRIMTSFVDMIKRANYANEYVKFMDYPPAMPKGELAVREGMHVFEFRNVTFSYPGSEVQVLRDVNLTIREGEHLSVVGLNGAGKTTLVKLLCRLYDPTEGEILMDGVNIKEYDYDAYMKTFAPVFQDFKLFAFTVQENLLLRDQFGEGDEMVVESALTKTGLLDRIRSFPDGFRTVLFKHFDKNGIEPSGGEQQKLAIARALIKDAPVVILDEPTAALDPIAEYEIYRQFEELVRDKTAIYISHRLSSCQFCDRIAVFSEGNVREYGTHKELVGLENGIYAEMFAAQAQYYT